MQAEEMAQWVEYLPFKYENLSSDAQIPTKYLGVVVMCVALVLKVDYSRTAGVCWPIGKQINILVYSPKQNTKESWGVSR